MLVRRKASLVACFIGTLVAHGLLADGCLGAPPLRLSLHSCEHLIDGEVERILLLELGSKRAEEGSVLVTEVMIECGPTRSIITVEDAITRKVLRRAIPADPTGEGQARLLALAASELLLASWAELDINPHPLVEPEGLVPSAELVSNAREALRARHSAAPRHPPNNRSSSEAARLDFETVNDDSAVALDLEPPSPVRMSPRDRHEQQRTSSRLRVLGVLSGRGILGLPGMLYGGGVRVGQDSYGVVAWTLDALLERGTVDADLGALGLTAVSVGGIVGYSHKASLMTLRAGGGLRWGLTVVQAELDGAAASSVTSSPWGWPVLSASLTLHTNEALVVEWGAEAGYAVLPVGKSSGIGAPALRGAWVGASFGVGVGP